MADFAPVIAFTLEAEGGFVDDPADPGGATNFGIILAGLSAWRGHPCTVNDVRTMSQVEAVAIYTRNYWQVVGGPSLPAGLDLVVFDFGVNAGPGTSAKMLQKLLGVVQDGQIGPVTLAAAQCSSALLRSRIADLSAAHEAYYHTLPGYAHDGRGWTARVDACQATATALAIGVAAPPVAPALPKPRWVAPATQPTADQLMAAEQGGSLHLPAET